MIKAYAWKSRAKLNIDGLVQDCSNSTANALELLQFCIKPSIYFDERERGISPFTVKSLI